MKLYQKVLLGAAGATGAGVVAWNSLFPWIEYDFKLMSIGRRVQKLRDEAGTSLLIDKFEKHVEKTPQKTFIIYEDNMYSFEFVDQMACKVANVAKSWGLQPKDCVALMIQNEPAFIWTFFGLMKLGVSVAMINYNVKSQPLVHCVKTAAPRCFIVGSGDFILKSVTEILDDLGNIQVFVQGLGTAPAPLGMQSFDPMFHTSLAVPISPVFRREVTMDDTCCYIYTSGTTGNPKPVTIAHAKVQAISVALQLVELKSTDVIYVVLPLYHTAGGGIGFFGSIYAGSTMVLRKKFSSTNFWSDCRKYDVTVIQYIGEMFRYLLAQPPNELDCVHKVRAAFGNGLRKDIWNDVSNRFRIPSVVEFFGATEGFTMLINLSMRPGAIGRISPFMSMIDPDPKVLVKFDYSSAMPIRDENGRCIKVGVGEPGLFLSKVPDNWTRDKDGQLVIYRNSQEATEKKLVRDAFKEGDIYFNYGDVFIMDKDYFVYFQDRIGDTFRWKGENVSTTEVANVLTSLPFLHDANVYGVTIPGHDGRAGMVAITLKEGYTVGKADMKAMYDHVCKELPTYARPLFVRCMDSTIMTSTFKQRKVELVNEGFDVEKVTEPLYFYDVHNETYSPVTSSDISKFLKSKL